MNFENQLIFFFSALGAFNGFLLSFFFAFIAQKKKFSNFFLALLLLTLSIRIIKSVFFYFNPNLSGVFIQIGISACILIGPFLYLYFASFIKNEVSRWKLNILPFIVGITILGIAYPYMEYRTIWSKWILKGIYIQWLIYIILSFKVIRPVFQRLFQKKEKLSSIDIWFLSVFIGVTVIWLAYNIGSYTSYIVGALSFSFVLYLIILLFIFKNNKKTSFFEEKEKYKNKEIDTETLGLIESKLSIVKDKELYCNPNITLTSIAKELNIPAHTLSQFLNDNFSKSFSLFINELRIIKAKELLSVPNQYTIEAIGYESGFNSKSTFYTTFKKMTGQTPSEYQKSLKK
ncbi:helix-turn-helix domain-containing protein [Lacinutrix salivirga]